MKIYGVFRSLHESRGVTNFKQVASLIVVPSVLLLSLSFSSMLMQGSYMGGQPMESILVVDSILMVLSFLVENLRALDISLLAAFLVT